MRVERKISTMTRTKLYDAIERVGLVPVIKISEKADASGLAKALTEGGLPAAEVTLRTSAAPEAIRKMKATCPQMIVGAGTVLSMSQVDAAADAGADFVVTPGLDPEIVRYCGFKEIPIIPGVSSASGIQEAISLGLNVVKFFPAELSGGLKAIKAMSGPFGSVRFMPTGGINASNLRDYLNDRSILACGGTWMVPEEALEAGDFDTIRHLTEEAVRTMLGFRLAHIGINSEDEAEAKQTAQMIQSLFAFQPNENPGSVFMDSYFEIMKTPFLGEKGHIAIATSSVERGKCYLERKGFRFREDSAVFRPDGTMQAVYLEQEVAGFAIHLVRDPQLG